MRLVFSTLGTLGDLAPLIGCACKLREDHEIVFLIDDYHRDLLKKYDLAMIPICKTTGQEWRDAWAKAKGQSDLESEESRWQRCTTVMNALFTKNMPQITATLDGFLRKSDVVIASTGIQFIIQKLIQKTVSKHFSINYYPAFDDPRLKSLVGDQMMVIDSRLYGSWKASHTESMEGFIHVQPEYPQQPLGDWQRPEDIRKILNKRNGYIFLSFGSIPWLRSESLVQLLSELVAGPYPVLLEGDAPETDRVKGLYVSKYIPHDVAFKNAACVIFHGGAGTSSRVISENCCNVVIPQWADQGIWGKSMELAGYSLLSFHEKTVSGKQIIEAIKNRTPRQELIAANIDSQTLSEFVISSI